MQQKVEPLSQGEPVRVLLVDDHPVFRQGLKSLLETQPDLVVCAQAQDAAEALEAAAAHDIDLAIVDITLKGRGGLEVVRDLKSVRPRLRVLVLSMHHESLYAERALRAGAAGYLNKQDAAAPCILGAVRRVLGGELYLSDALVSRLVRRAVEGEPAPLGEPPVAHLSDRELEVFQLMGEGLSTRQIAARLFRSIKTVESHRENIKAKLGIATGAELVRLAVEQHLSGWLNIAELPPHAPRAAAASAADVAHVPSPQAAPEALTPAGPA